LQLKFQQQNQINQCVLLDGTFVGRRVFLLLWCAPAESWIGEECSTEPWQGHAKGETPKEMETIQRRHILQRE